MKAFYKVLRKKVWDKIMKEACPEYLTGSTEEI
jgi:hypothetical protein